MNGKVFGQEQSHLAKRRKKTLTLAKSQEWKEKEMIAREKNKIKKESQKVNEDDMPLASFLLDDVHARMESPMVWKTYILLRSERTKLTIFHAWLDLCTW